MLFFSGTMEIGWRFFNMVVCCKRGGRKKERKKWFELSHIRDNHPRNGYAKEYEESRAWCEAQKMQDCYIQSVDGLKLHGFYLPAENAKRFVILTDFFHMRNERETLGIICYVEEKNDY